MDFNSLGENSQIHIIRKKPFEYVIGTLKSKSSTMAQSYLPNPQSPINLVVTVDGNDEAVNGVPPQVEVVQFGNSFYATTTDGVLQAVASMMQMAKEGLDSKDYFESVLENGEKIKEQINPQYAENKRLSRVTAELQQRADKQDEKLDKILGILQDFTTPSK